MDYSLAALKVVCAQLKDAHDVPSQNALTLGGILFQRAWLQGILVSNSGDGRFLLDDGTGVIELHLSGDFRSREWDVGCTCFFLLSSTFLVRLLVRLLGLYVMVVGGYFLRKGDTPMVKVHKIVDLSPFPDREAMWYLEVIEAYKLFYQPLIEEFV
ncbi:hypothetical protein HS088_TW02G00604 [Tripterygium wilfordii]|uniref:RecQ-mediated genome instability protein 2 n=1 Tax=Tripterygium wilfordii TaxID=458696 RepID=A0A7J7DZ77_TRIWF|nr:uncharacterized protein LOC120012081 isoform X1 [Tripterygium wilfordii]KAF5751589.1 hypothetical protein HS088_TW02G00604 [Tripterygium wilfordii]